MPAVLGHSRCVSLLNIQRHHAVCITLNYIIHGSACLPLSHQGISCMSLYNRVCPNSATSFMGRCVYLRQLRHTSGCISLCHTRLHRAWVRVPAFSTLSTSCMDQWINICHTQLHRAWVDVAAFVLSSHIMHK
ncbi:hypothetical protein PoB_007594400 [Plakobranchus ocellatus]|uniref:Uncharacterized protein n=1 Tax=Plakobranchus ocellatus TaxID=259542 RepID=A0AAV4DZD8_9GAST|nr:hypothetical protein PoB_007594400 [Plakobranchus ocellatus]